MASAALGDHRRPWPVLGDGAEGPVSRRARQSWGELANGAGRRRGPSAAFQRSDQDGNGRAITFKGRIPEAGGGHIRVILQALARGEWVTFKTVGLRRGRFNARYRFTGTRTTTRYRFRAVVVEQPDLPFRRGDVLGAAGARPACEERVMKRVSLAALALSLIGQTPTAAADPPQTYVVPVCSTVAGPHPLAGWARSDPQSAAGFDACQAGGGFGGVGGKPDRVFWSYRSPADTEVVALRIWRFGAAAQSTSYGLVASGNDRREVVLEDSTQLGLGPVAGKEFPGFRATELRFWLSCPPESCSSTDAWVRFSRMEMVVRDQVNPRVTTAGGPAVSSSPISGSSQVSASFADVGGGVSSNRPPGRWRRIVEFGVTVP